MGVQPYHNLNSLNLNAIQTAGLTQQQQQQQQQYLLLQQQQQQQLLQRRTGNAAASSGLTSAASYLNPAAASYNRRNYANYDYYDDYGVDRIGGIDRTFGGSSDHHASHSGYGYCEEDQVSLSLLVTALAGLALMGYTLYTKIQANGGRRKRSEDAHGFNPIELVSAITNGNLITVNFIPRIVSILSYFSGYRCNF